MTHGRETVCDVLVGLSQLSEVLHGLEDGVLGGTAYKLTIYPLLSIGCATVDALAGLGLLGLDGL